MSERSADYVTTLVVGTSVGVLAAELSWWFLAGVGVAVALVIAAETLPHYHNDRVRVTRTRPQQKEKTMATYDHPVPATPTGGCVRFTKDGPQIHHNETHTSSGIRSVSIDDRGRLEVKHAAPGPIITMNANADETLVARGIAFGCSGGGGTTIIVASGKDGQLDLNDPDDYKKVAGTYSNIWLYWLHATK